MSDQKTPHPLLGLLSHSLGNDWTFPAIETQLKTVAKYKRLAPSTELANLIPKITNAFKANEKVGKPAFTLSPELFEFLQILTNDAAESRHDHQVELDRPFEVAGKANGANETLSIEGQLQMRRFQEFWTDLKDSIIVLQGLHDRIQESKGALNILVLDDKPDGFSAFAQEVVDAFFGDWVKINFYDPLNLKDKQSNGDSEKLFRFFTGYETLGTPKLGTSDAEQDSTELQTLRKALEDFRWQLKGVRFILVDQFFKLKRRGRSEFLGPQFIRGLIRWLHDNQKLVDEIGCMPEIIALSRTDEPNRIREAIGAGARDYIVKSRFVSLPAVMARVCRGTWERENKLHRSFRALYDLNNETLGLLHNTRLPRIPFHSTLPVGNAGDVKITDAKDGKRAMELTADIAAKAGRWTELLTRLPKTDLHVHAGSIMAREFLVVASLVMLSRFDWKKTVSGKEPSKNSASFGLQLQRLVAFFHAVLGEKATSGEPITLIPIDTDAFGGAEPNILTQAEFKPKESIYGKNWIVGWGMAGKALLKECLQSEIRAPHATRALRAALHRGLKIPDHLEPRDAMKLLESKDNLAITLHLVRNASAITLGGQPFELDLGDWKSENLIRVYLLVLGSRYHTDDDREAKLCLKELCGFDFLKDVFGSVTSIKDPADSWSELGRLFWSNNPSSPEKNEVFSMEGFINRGWSWPEADWSMPFVLKLPRKVPVSEDVTPPDFVDDPIGYTLATGTRSKNLVQYLLGCEFSGAEHLRHPFLIHVYARQVVMDWVRQGVFYAELKASPDGYINTDIGFEFPMVTRCLIRAFSEAQEFVLREFQQISTGSNPPDDRSWAGCILGKRYEFKRLHDLLQTGREEQPARNSLDDPDNPTDAGIPPMPARLPVKASLIFVGKRHKSLREMILEAAGAAVLRPFGDDPVDSAQEFIDKEFRKCRVVGFDLAGPEEGNPPSKHAPEFGRLDRLHLPITVHAGENAPAEFIEDSILQLGAKRIGHGLSLVEDERLIARVRDDGITIELCPVCNHQTSQFHAPEERAVDRRAYPLKKLLGAGVRVTLNTDNPIISNTDMIREFYQASYAYDKGGLTLWDALRIIRMGFVGSFLNLAERRHLIEIVEQRLFDIFSDEKTVRILRQLAMKRPSAIKSPESSPPTDSVAS